MANNVSPRWVSAHAAAPLEAYEGYVPDVTGRTVRCDISVGMSGQRLRLIFTERLSKTPVTYGHMVISVKGQVRTLTFGGQESVTIPTDGEVFSDPVELPVSIGDILTLWMYNSGDTFSMTATRLESSYSVPGDMCGADFEPQPFETEYGTTLNQPLCSYTRIEVETAEESACAIAAFGDSITAMELWTPTLREMIAAARPHTALVNLGIGGNRLLRDTGFPSHPGVEFFGRSGLSRFDTDCLSQPGLRGIIIALGINDLGAPGDDAYWNPPRSDFPTFEQLTGGFVQLVDRCRKLGLTVACATITALNGTWTYTDEVENMRCRVNDWIRTCGQFDAVLDFDAAIGQGKGQPMLPEFDSGDHIHPNKDGGKAMAQSVDVDELLSALLG